MNDKKKALERYTATAEGLEVEISEENMKINGMEQEPPFFLSNAEWYYYDDIEGRYKLTDKAPKEAIKSYDEFYADEE